MTLWIGEMAEEQNPREIRYKSLPLPIKVLLHGCYVVGVGLGIYFMFGFTFGGFVFLDAQYYYLLFGIFGACAFLILPADTKIKWHHYARLAFGVKGFGPRKDVHWAPPGPPPKGKPKS